MRAYSMLVILAVHPNIITIFMFKSVEVALLGGIEKSKNGDHYKHCEWRQCNNVAG